MPEDRIGGPIINTISVSKELKKEGIDVKIVVPKENNISESNGLKVYKILLKRPRQIANIPTIFENIKWFLSFPITVFKLIRIIKKEKIDIVHNNTSLNLQAPFACRFTKTKLVWHLNDTLLPSFCKRIVVPIIKLLSDKIVVFSQDVADFYFDKKIPKNKIEIIYPSVNTKKFNPKNISQEQKEKLKKKLDIKPGEKVIGEIGNLNPIKGHIYFIEAASLVCKKHKDTKFIIVGSILQNRKKYFKQLKNYTKKLRLEDKIIFTGYQSNIPLFLSIMDVFVLSSIAEACPTVTLEAMAMTTPVVSTRVGGITTQIIPEKTGLIVEIRNSQQISQACLRFLENQKLARKMGQKARIKVQEKFSLEKCVIEHQNLYQSLID